MAESKSGGDAYADLIAKGRRRLVDLIKQYPDEWTDEEALGNFIDSDVRPNVVPEDADLAWALRVIEAKPAILERENNETPGTVISTIFNAIEEQVEEDLITEFRPVTDRLCYPDGVPDDGPTPSGS